MTERDVEIFGIPGLLWRVSFRSRLRFFSLLAVMAVASLLLCGALFFQGGVEAAISRGMERLGADLMVIPQGGDVPLQKGLLGGVPVTFSLPPGMEEGLASVSGVAAAAPQYFLASARASCCEAGNLLLVGYDPGQDFTVLPWKGKAAGGRPADDALLVGGAVMKGVGAQLRFYNHTFTVAGRLEKSGMGYFDNAVFIPLAGVAAMERSSRSPGAVPITVPWGRPSLLLVKAAAGAVPEDVAEGIRSRYPGVRVLTMPEVFRQAKQRLGRISGLLVPLAASAWVVVTAIVAAAHSLYLGGRKQALGLLRVMGASRLRIVMMFAGESLALASAGAAAGSLSAFWIIRMFAPYFAVVSGFPLLLNLPVIAGSAAPPLIALFLATTLLQSVLTVSLFLRAEPYELIRGEG